jgi:autotransporter strand-loop-strand O-heptosyltransferase
MAYSFNEDIFVVDCWLDTEEKEKTLINLLDRIKTFNIPIILCGHYPIKPEIQKQVDYFIYDKNNDILLEKDFNEYEVVSDRWTIMNDYKVFNKVDFHHDYAIWLTMKNAFNLAKQLGKKYIHFLEYDNLPDETQYRQAFMEYVRSNDAVVYEYKKGSTNENPPYSSTFIFSIKTDTALSVINQINSKEEYFKNKPNGWQLERVFYQTLKKVTNNIFVSKYIPNENELNIFAAWNRNGILKNGATFQTYLALDHSNKLFIHFISGFTEKQADKDYLCEVNYGNRKFFYTIKKDQYHLELLGDYVKDEYVRVFYQGIEIFTQHLKEDAAEFKRKNILDWKHKESNRKINIHFVDGPFVEILDDIPYTYNIQFINRKNDKVEYETVIGSNQWCRPSIKYFVDWDIKIVGIDNDYNGLYKFTPKDNKFYISFESKSLGDSLAFIPYVEEFRKQKQCKVVCSTFHNDLFEKVYPEIEFVNPGSSVDGVLGLYRIGLFYNKEQVDYEWHPYNPLKEPLQKIASDILGLDYKEILPKVPSLGGHKKKRVCIAIHSTSQCKYWNNTDGWQKVVDYVKSKGYEVRLLSREEDGYMGNKHPKGIKVQPPSSTKDVLKVLQESHLFIGISSGLSWLAWSSGIPVVLISGFTDIYLEPFKNIERIINKDVCHGCWHNHKFDPGNWNWCPIHEKTDKQFECSKEITSEQVISKIEKFF